MAKTNRILIECTHTYESDINTGIQRVVRNIVNESEHIANKLGVTCQPIIFNRDAFFIVRNRKGFILLITKINTFLRKKYWSFRLALSSIPILNKLIMFLFPRYIRSNIRSIIIFILYIMMYPARKFSSSIKKVVPNEGDLLLLLDSSWHLPLWPAVKRAKKNGAKVGIIIYDLIPITHHQFFVPELVKCFRNWVKEAIKNVDFFIAISQTTRDEVKKYVESNQPSINWVGRFESFHLGSVIDNIISDGKVRDELTKLFESSDKPRTYLAVGTIEPRKNHKYLMDAFAEVWEKCPDVCLCIVGRIGWLCEEIVRRIKSHPGYKKFLFMFNNLSDTELDYCYSHAKALVFPSHAEGFGLPIVESLYHELPVLASDIPIHRETGKDFCAYFDISKPASLAKIITNIEKGGKMPKVRKPEEYQLPTWKDSCRELITKSVALYERVSV